MLAGHLSAQCKPSSLMGNSFPCPCSESAKGGVTVMKADGSLLRLKRGIHAREIVASNMGFRVVRCDSDRTILKGSAELECNRLYFLVPKDKAWCSTTYEKFWKTGESKGLVPPRMSKGREGDGTASGPSTASVEFRRLSWAPQLRTIPEILSPAAVKEKEKESSAMTAMRSPMMTACSVREQFAVSSPVSSPVMVR